MAVSNFRAIFEKHKVPEWYDKYFDMENMLKLGSEIKSECDKRGIGKLPGIYYLTIGGSSKDSNAYKFGLMQLAESGELKHEFELEDV
jgi:hypothetical protein